jgi:hypothetical protein
MVALALTSRGKIHFSSLAWTVHAFETEKIGQQNVESDANGSMKTAAGAEKRANQFFQNATVS